MHAMPVKYLKKANDEHYTFLKGIMAHMKGSMGQGSVRNV